MDGFIRSARSGSDWGRNELLAYHITIAPIPPQEFFRQEADPPLTGLDPALINSPLDLDDTNVSNNTYHFLAYLDLATHTSQETGVGDFARELSPRSWLRRTRTHLAHPSHCPAFYLWRE
jgi:hypothetical protein